MNTPLHPPAPGLPDAVELVARSVAALRTRRLGMASALCWRGGLLVTAASAIGHAERVQVVLPGGEAIPGTVRGIDAGTDIAVIAVEAQAASGLQAVERAAPRPVRVGEFVFAAGRDAAGRVHASFGHVGAAAGAWRSWRGGQLHGYIRLDGGLYPGLAGAPVADAQGQVLGIASAAFDRHHGIVIPAETLAAAVEPLLAHGRIRRGHLGIAAQPVALAGPLREAAGTGADAALLIAGIGDDSPAARAGLMLGDVLVSAGGRDVAGLGELRELLGPEHIGSRLRLVVLRGGQRLELSAEVGEQPSRRC